ncbi:hypothetical protein V1477_003409 [Vespula maculifrons]|uniref:Uncharacterized protein n=1 Tax=Vespula maculifrons TaxID=7453 RepID=A0ABD2CUF6_VESMC
MFGGDGKTVQIDETFLTKWKYHRSRATEQMSIVIPEFTLAGLMDKKDILNLKNLEFFTEDVNSVENYLLPFKRQREMPIDEDFDFKSFEDDVDNPLFDSL